MISDSLFKDDYKQLIAEANECINDIESKIKLGQRYPQIAIFAYGIIRMSKELNELRQKNNEVL